jgi:PAS domain S-box-containing protein
VNKLGRISLQVQSLCTLRQETALHKLGAALVVTIVLALLASAQAVIEVRSTASNLEQLLQQDVATLSSMHELAVRFEDAARSARMVLMYGTPRFMQQLSETRARGQLHFEALQARISTNEQQRLLARVLVLREQAVEEMDGAIETARAGDLQAASVRVLERVEPLRERIADLMRMLVEEKKSEIGRLTSEYARASDRTLRLSALFGSLALLCGVVLAILLQQAVRRGSQSELRLRNVFQGAAVAIMEEDYSRVARALDELRAQGVTDLAVHIQQHPELLGQIVEQIEIRAVNPAMNALVETRSEERIRTLKPFFAPDTIPVFRNALIALWNGQRQFRSETVLKTLTGKQTDALLTISYPPDLQREAVIVTFTDISARKREERRSRETLELSEARLRAVFDQCPVGISMTDVAGRLVYLNPTAQRLMKSSSNAQATRSLEVVAAQDRARIAEWRQNFLHGRTQQSELTMAIQTMSGEIRSLRIQANLLREAEEVRGIVCTIEDVTERLRLEQQLRQAQKMEAVGQLAGGVAHDFNNLLTIILNGVALLQAGASKEQADLLGQVDAAADRAASLTAQLLAFGRKQVIRSRVVDLNELVTNHCRLLQRLVGEKIQLVTKLDPGGAPADVDPNLMELLLMNLVVNARDALPLGGQIEIRLASLVVEEERSKALLVLSVSDNGSGIPAEHLPHVFEPFYTTKAVGKGTGLGLATVYGIVEQHHGRIEVDSSPERGTTFHVYLPRAEATLSPVLETPAQAPDGHETLLLVEDEAGVRQMVAASLARCGYHVIEAANGDAALLLWHKHAARIDLLLTDMVMPGNLSGRELALRLRADRPELKVVYISGYGAHDLANEPWSILVQKPFQLSTLAQALRARLDEKEAAMQSQQLLVGHTTHTRGIGLV